MITIYSEGVRVNVKIDKFSDNTKKICFSEDISNSNHIAIKWNYEEDSELVELIYLTRHIQDIIIRGKCIIALHLNYVPNARMDRVEDNKLEVFTLKYFTDIINSLHFDKVYILDPHSRVTPGLIDRVEIVKVEPIITRLINYLQQVKELHELVLFYPDKGAADRYTKPLYEYIKRECKELPTTVAYGEKTRDWNTAQIIDFKIKVEGSELSGKPILIIDDIISSGGTLKKCIEELQKMGVGSINIYGTHLENKALDNENFCWVLNNCDRVYTTGSIYKREHEKIEVI